MPALTALLLVLGPVPAAQAVGADDADLAVAVSASPDTVGPGGTLTYTVALSNAGPAAATAVEFETVTPADTELTGLTPPPGWLVVAPPAGGNGTVRASRETLPAGEAGKLVLSVTVTGGTRIDFRSRIASAAPDPNPANDTAAASTAVVDAANLALTVSDSADPVAAGTRLSYAITLTNSGPATATDPRLSTATPANTMLTEFTVPSGWQVDAPSSGGSGPVRSTTGRLPPGERRSFTLVVTVDQGSAHGAELRFAATVTASTPDPDAGNNTVRATTAVVNAADLAVTVSASPDPAVAGGTLSYALTLTNNGPVAAVNAALSADIPAGTAFASLAAPAGWTTTTPAPGAGGAVAATVASLPSGGTAAFTLTVTAGSNGQATLVATASTATVDPAAANNSATATTLVAPAPPTTPVGPPGAERGGLPLTGSSAVRLAGVTIALLGLGILLAATARSRRSRRRRAAIRWSR